MTHAWGETIYEQLAPIFQRFASNFLNNKRTFVEGANFKDFFYGFSTWIKFDKLRKIAVPFTISYKLYEKLRSDKFYYASKNLCSLN